MKLTIEQITGVVKAISAIGMKDVPVRTAFALARIHRTLTDELKTFESLRQKIMRDNHVTPDTPPSPETVKVVDAKMKELSSTEIEVDFPQLDLSEFGDIQVTPGVASTLLPLVKDK